MKSQVKTASRKSRRTRPVMPTHLERLEPRQMLSVTMEPMLTLTPSATGSVSGYTPSQVSQAYGYNQLSGDGSGQTIAIVDAYRDPNIAADLHTFDQKFGLTDPNLSIVNQTGGSANSVTANAGWSTEIALDVEWAHALAPKANIMLVETNSSSLTDLMTGVDYARHAAGVSVVSMSWGGSEFWGQQQYDSIFTTPAGHNGVTFIAASGDSGSWYGPSWPASSPNVLAIGGTSLRLTSSGAYGSETGWSYSTGGISAVYSEPAYQSAAQHTGGRTTPDVAFNATGFAIYSSVRDQGISGWSVVGGTSAGAPSWSALIAIANQVRTAAGKGTLDGATGTLPALYAMYGPVGTTSYAAYTAAFNDITVGRSSYFMSAHVGYDGVTGLGSPRAAQVVAQLAGNTTASSFATIQAPPAAPVGPARRPVIHQTVTVTPEASAANALASAPAPAAFVTNALLQHAGDLHAVAVSSQSLTIGRVEAGSLFSSDGIFAASDQPSRAFGALGDLGARVAAASPQALHMAAALAETSDVALPIVARQVMPKFVFADTLAVMSADGIREFAHESAMLGAAIGNELLSTHGRAQKVTVFTLAADAIIISAWAAHAWQKRQQRKTQRARSMFQETCPVGPFDRDEQ